ncbi:MAG: adenosine kinase [Pyrinomonadaceae bacterium]|nr:adenosine kinase [Pyrinomonadaceae bacterium]
MKRFELCGLGNSLIDILVDIEEESFRELGLEKVTMRLVESGEQSRLLSRFADAGLSRASGGSVANSVISFAQLGGRAAFLGSVADDQNGNFYRHEFETLGIAFPVPPASEGATGTSLVLITPDAERTMRTSLGVSTSLSAKHMDEKVISDSEWLFVEGYLFANPENGQQAVARAIEVAKRNGCRVAVTFSESWVVETFRESVESAVKNADLIFANETEACAYAGVKDVKEAFHFLKKLVPNVAITLGPKGSLIYFGGVDAQVEAFPCEPVDLTGAGDMFAGAFLYGVVNGVEPSDAARRANLLASKVISQLGARMQSGIAATWKEA